MERNKGGRFISAQDIRRARQPVSSPIERDKRRRYSFLQTEYPHPINRRELLILGGLGLVSIVGGLKFLSEQPSAPSFSLDEQMRNPDAAKVMGNSFISEVKIVPAGSMLDQEEMLLEKTPINIRNAASTYGLNGRDTRVGEIIQGAVIKNAILVNGEEPDSTMPGQWFAFKAKNVVTPHAFYDTSGKPLDPQKLTGETLYFYALYGQPVKQPQK